MTVAYVLTPRAGDGLTPETAFRPLVADLLLLPNEKMLDVTAIPAERQPSDPDLMIVLVDARAATLTTIGADSRFLVMHGPTRNPDATVPDAEYVALRAFLALRVTRQADVDAGADTAVRGRTRRKLADDLTAWLGTRPKRV